MSRNGSEPSPSITQGSKSFEGSASRASSQPASPGAVSSQPLDGTGIKMEATATDVTKAVAAVVSGSDTVLTGSASAGASKEPSRIATPRYTPSPTEQLHPLLENAQELVAGALYFASLTTPPFDAETMGLEGQVNNGVYFFSVDHVFHYMPYFADFGPYKLSHLVKFCRELTKQRNTHKRVCVFTSHQVHKRANATCLVGCYLALCENMPAADAWNKFKNIYPAPLHFRDAYYGASTMDLSIPDCIAAVSKAKQLGWLDIRRFDVDFYEHHEQLVNGDFNWIVPGKIIAFSSPGIDPVGKAWPAEAYVSTFRRLGIQTVVRLNEKRYDATIFTCAGIKVVELEFPDGSTPCDAIVQGFMEAVAASQGGVAVHCRAGLGRTGTLIGLHMMKAYGLSYKDVIAWQRLCRPGMVIGPQQQYLQAAEDRVCRNAVCREPRRAGGRPSSAQFQPPPMPTKRKEEVITVASRTKALLRDQLLSARVSARPKLLPDACQSTAFLHPKELTTPRLKEWGTAMLNSSRAAAADISDGTKATLGGDKEVSTARRRSHSLPTSHTAASQPGSGGREEASEETSQVPKRPFVPMLSLTTTRPEIDGNMFATVKTCPLSPRKDEKYMALSLKLPAEIGAEVLLDKHIPQSARLCRSLGFEVTKPQTPKCPSTSRPPRPSGRPDLTSKTRRVPNSQSASMSRAGSEGASSAGGSRQSSRHGRIDQTPFVVCERRPSQSERFRFFEHRAVPVEQ